MAGKWLELLKEISPRVARVAMLFNPATAPYAEYWLTPFKAAAASFAVQATVAPVHDTSNSFRCCRTRARTEWRPDCDAGYLHDRPSVGDHIAGGPLPSPCRLSIPCLPQSGGLLSYGDDLTDNFWRASSYVDRILKGEKPSELPVQAPVKFELVLNLKAAKALGLDVPVHLQQRADEVIE